MNPNLKKYIEDNIFPMYDRYYSHGMLHINNVINNCLMLADYYNLDEKSFLDHLLSLHFISESLYEELKNIYLHKLKKKEKRLR